MMHLEIWETLKLLLLFVWIDCCKPNDSPEVYSLIKSYKECCMAVSELYLHILCCYVHVTPSCCLRTHKLAPTHVHLLPSYPDLHTGTT